MNALDTQIDTLQDLVRRCRVCWQVWPEFAMVGAEQRQIGFELELSGTHEPHVKNPSPGCEQCRWIFSVLVEIAKAILPREKRPSRYEVEPYEKRIVYAQARDYRPDVTLKIKALHREQGLAPVDACEIRCIKDMQDRLKDLGACQGSWARRKEQS